MGKIVHGKVPEENISNIDKKNYLRKHGIHYMVQRARSDMDRLIETLEKLRIAVGNANEEFVRENNNNNIIRNNNNNSDSDSDSNSKSDSDSDDVEDNDNDPN